MRRREDFSLNKSYIPGDCLKSAEIAGERVDRLVEGGVPPWWNGSRPRLATNTEG